MKTNYKTLPKTLGPQAALLVAELNHQGKTIFTSNDVVAISGLNAKSARNLAASLVNRGIATRLKAGLFNLVPFELGHETTYLENPFFVVEALAGSDNYYISHGSAMASHRMVTQPQLITYASTPATVPSRTILGMEFRFVRTKAEHMFGIDDVWIEKTRTIHISDLERTIIDGLKMPQYCGGMTEVAKGIWMRLDAIDIEKLIVYARRLNVGAVKRRLGFLLELFEINSMALEQLRSELTTTYMLFDPELTKEGKHIARWRLQLNLEPEEILQVVGT